MEFKHLERIQQLMSTKSTSEFGVGHSTARIKSNFEDGSGALAKIKLECDSAVQYASNIYCIECKTSYLRLRFLLHAKMLEWLSRDNKDKSKGLLLVEIALDKVFKGKYQTLEQCGERFGMSKVGYTKTWQKYVDEAVAILASLLFTANIVAGDYFYDEAHNLVKNEIKITY